MERQSTELGVSVLVENKELIETFVQLVMCSGVVRDYRFAWFYEAVPQPEIKKILHLIEEDDIRNDIVCFVLSKHSGYQGTDFSSYLRLSLGLFVRDKVRGYIKQYQREEVSWQEHISPEQVVDLKWAIKDELAALTRYEHYILYLFVYKCYPITEISQIVYQDVSTVRSILNEIKKEFTNG